MERLDPEQKLLYSTHIHEHKIGLHVADCPTDVTYVDLIMEMICLYIFATAFNTIMNVL